MAPRVFDSHSHLDDPAFDEDRPAVIQRAREAGVCGQLVPAIDAESWPKLKSVCASDSGLYPAFGLHPMLVARHRAEHLEQLVEWIERERPVAVGECGLDFYVEGLDAQAQREFFLAQLQIARDHGLPVVVHARRAVEEVIASIRRVGNLTGVVHSFPGSEEQARQLYSLGFLLGIGGPVTYDRAKRLRHLVATMPIESMLLETDSPDQPDSGHRGLRNEPARVITVLEVVASLRQAEPAQVAAATTANAQRLFALA